MPRIETLPVDELGKFVKASDPTSESPDERDKRGRFKKGSRTAQATGGRRRRKTVKLTRRMGLMDETQLLPEFVPYKRAAEAFRRAMVGELAQNVGGGTCGAMASSLVTKAAWQEAAGTFFFEKAMETGNVGMAKMASSILNDGRQNSLAAIEICAKMAGNGKRVRNDTALVLAQAEFQKRLVAEQSRLRAKQEDQIVTDGAETEA